jgi:polysaccharide export outer membrane protein
VGTLRAIRVLTPLALLLAGCADARFLNRTCPQPADPKSAAEAPSPDSAYRVGCPDAVRVAFRDRPEWDAVAAIDIDGTLPLGDPASPRVEGLTLDEVRALLAQIANTPPDRVSVSLAAARSSRVYLHGPCRGKTRVVPYQGPEPVIAFLQRVGGLPPGSKVSQVYVVRPNVAAGARPEVFRVDVPAVLLDHDHGTNVPLAASDQVYVGETRKASFARVVPDWFRPAYRKLTGLLPDDWWPFPPRGP